MTTIERDRAIFNLLGMSRGIDRRHLAREHFQESAVGELNCRRWVARHVRNGLLTVFRVIDRPVTEVELVCTGSPDRNPPDFGRLSRESCRRWSAIAPDLMTVVRATNKLRNIIGAPRRPFVSLGQVGHDMGLTAVLLHKAREDRRVLDSWFGEDELPHPLPGDAQPDAAILRPNGTIACAIEFASAYSAEKFRKLDRTFRVREIPYEIWMPVKGGSG
jgi:hypothetical protein